MDTRLVRDPLNSTDFRCEIDVITKIPVFWHFSVDIYSSGAIYGIMITRNHQSKQQFSGSALATKNLWLVVGICYPVGMDRVELPILGVQRNM